MNDNEIVKEHQPSKDELDKILAKNSGDLIEANKVNSLLVNNFIIMFASESLVRIVFAENIIPMLSPHPRLSVVMPFETAQALSNGLETFFAQAEKDEAVEEGMLEN